MEVHAHSHTSDPPDSYRDHRGRKKWTHYLWEFFMLFMAVTLGFFVENQREHYVEHGKEKQYMKSMIEDLIADTAEMNKILSTVDSSSQNVDSMLVLLTTGNITDDAVIRSYQFTFPALNNIPIVFNDRTITQLKNSGNMRIIRNQKVNDGLVKYWNHIEIITASLTRHTAYRTKGRDMETRIFNTAEIFLKNNGRIAKPSSNVHLIVHDLPLIKEYANVISYCGVILLGLHKQIIEQQQIATELIELIKKEYHLA